MTTTVYSRPDYAQIDIGARMRRGHPYIADGDAYIVRRVTELAGDAGRPIRVLEVGAGSGCLVEQMRRAMPQAQLVANEVEPHLLELARRRFAGTDVVIHAGPFDTWSEPIDVLVSWGSHHHLSNAYLAHARTLLRPDGVLLLGDEFCPDYCTDDDRTRIADAELVYLAAGHLLTRHAEVAEFQRNGTVPEWSTALERRRQQALWRWYRHVVDWAMAREDTVVAATELQIAMDDIRTDFAAEHKLAPCIAARDLELNGFRMHRRIALEENDPDRASFFVFELHVDPSFPVDS